MAVIHCPRESPKRVRNLLVGLLLSLAALAIGAHLIVPPILLRGLNHRLQAVPGYNGHADALSLGWFSASLTIRQLKLAKRDLSAPGAVVSVGVLQVRFSWVALFRRRLVLTLTLNQPEVLVLMCERRVGQPLRTGLWRAPFARFPPFRVDRIVFHEGTLRFKNDDALPPIDVSFDALDLTATAIANRTALAGSRTVHVEGRARMQNQAPMQVTLDIRPFRDPAEFVIRGELHDFDLTLMNGIMRHYTGMELKKGALTLRMNLAIQDGAFQGHVRRTITHLTVKKNGPGFLKTVKENLAQAWLNAHENPHTDHLDKEFTYAGPLGFLNQDVVMAAVWVAKGAFIQALKATLPDQAYAVTPERALDEWAEFQAKQRKKAGRVDSCDRRDSREGPIGSNEKVTVSVDD